MPDIIYSLQQQIQETEENLLLIEEQESEYVQKTDVPLQLVKDKRRLEALRDNLKKRLQDLQQVPCPYRGLEPFDVEHASYFFGREAMIAKLVAKVDERNFVAVVGPSGCGKSSLARAGLIAELGKGALPGSQHWETEILRPGADPLRSLAMALVTRLEPEKTSVEQIKEARKLADSLRNGEIDISKDVMPVVRQRKSQTLRFLLLIDQFEEVFDPRVDETSRQAFRTALLNVGQDDWLKIVLTVRADFYNRLLDDRQLGELVDKGLVNVLPMSEAERRAAIEKPAWATGRRFEEGLVNRILDAVETSPGDLPLLEFALTELWRRQTHDGVLTHAAYEESGEISGAIAYRATAVFSHLNDDQQRQAHRLFKRLVRLPQADEIVGQATRRRINLDDLDPAVQGLAQEILASERLLITDQDSATGKTTVELVHEALITNWQQLRDWLSEDPDGLRLQQSLSEAVQIWERYDQDPDVLYRGQRLAEALQWANGHGEEINTKERQFLDASQANQRKRGLRTAGAVVLAVAAMIALFAVGYWLRPNAADRVAIPMPANDFNIAVAPFTAQATEATAPDLLQDLQRDGQSFAQSTAETLEASKAAIQAETGWTVNVAWPDQLELEATDPAYLKQKARELNADILVYGVLRPSSGRFWEVEPRFYVGDRITGARAGEITGEEELGRPIRYQPGNQSFERDVADALRLRLDVLAQLINGLAYYDRGDARGYEQARQVFCSAANSLGQTNDDSNGAELLYLFCGHANTHLAWQISETASDEERAKSLLEDGVAAYQNGLEVNPQHIRSRVSLGAALTQIGSPNLGCENGDPGKLEAARKWLEDSRVDPEALSEGLRTGIYLSLGHIYFAKGWCYESATQDLWATAQDYYNRVLAIHQASVDPDHFTAATAHIYLGHLSALVGGFDQAIVDYEQALDLLQQEEDESAIKLATDTAPIILSVYCQAGQADSARERLDELVNGLPNPDDVRNDILSQLNPQVKEACGL